MSLIEGIGDEVIHFFIILCILLFGVIAWWSTNITERLIVRTVLIVEGRRSRPIRRQETGQQSVDSTNTEDENGANTMTTAMTTDQVTVDNNVDGEDDDKDDNNRANILQETINESSTLESPDIVHQQVTGSEESDLRNRRLAFFNTKHTEPSDSLVQTQNQQLKELIKDTREGHIRIRLKYLNDDQKLVEGKLQEQLGDFKKRHFMMEFGARKLVRLIFNGQVLQQDTMTLENYGLFDNCVVHCLVHQPRTNTTTATNNSHQQQQVYNFTTNENNEQVREWDLGRIFLATISLLLCFAWYGRYQYAQLFSTTSTVALVTLTGIFTVSLLGMYLPDTDGVTARRRL